MLIPFFVPYPVWGDNSLSDVLPYENKVTEARESIAQTSYIYNPSLTIHPIATLIPNREVE
jgi:hypothetical protein